MIENGIYIPVRYLNHLALRDVIELTKCGCKLGCKGVECGCSRADFLAHHCVCKCYADESANTISDVVHDDENVQSM